MADPYTYGYDSDGSAASVLNPRVLPSFARAQQNGVAGAGIDNPAQFFLDTNAQTDLYNKFKGSLTTQYPFLENDPNFNNDLSSAYTSFLKEGVQRAVDPNPVLEEKMLPVLAKWQMRAARMSALDRASAQAGYEGLVDRVGAGAALQQNPSILATPMRSRALELTDQERNNNVRFGSSGNRQLSDWIHYKQAMLQELVKARQNILPGMKLDQGTVETLEQLKNEILNADDKIRTISSQGQAGNATESAAVPLSSSPPLPSFPNETPTRYGQVYHKGDAAEFVNTAPTRLRSGQSLKITNPDGSVISLSGDTPTSTAPTPAANDLGLTESYADIPTDSPASSVSAPATTNTRQIKKTIGNSGVIGMIPEAVSAAEDLLGTPIESSREGKYGVLPQALTSAGDLVIDTAKGAASAASGLKSVPTAIGGLLFGTPETPLPMPSKTKTDSKVINRPITQGDLDKLQSGDLYLNPSDGKVYAKK